MSERLLGFDSGMSLSIHDAIGRISAGFIGGGIPGGALSILDLLGGGSGRPKKAPGKFPSREEAARQAEEARRRARRGLIDPGFRVNRCSPPLIRDQSGICVFPGSPGDISTDPVNGQGSIAASGRLSVPPIRSSVSVDKCPRFADGATGILWMNALTGQVVCLPRRANGRAFGLIRKNKPRRKAFISAADKKQLDKISSVQNKAKSFATAAGFKCTNTTKRVKGTPKKKAS